MLPVLGWFRGDTMSEKMEMLLSHAGRCERMANHCRDGWVAEKLRQLADDYRELAAESGSSLAFASGPDSKSRTSPDRDSGQSGVKRVAH